MPLRGSSHIKLPKKLDHPKNDLINIQNIDDNALNGAWLDIYILQDIMQQKLDKLTKTLQENLIMKLLNFPTKLETFTKLKKTYLFNVPLEITG